ncbi:MAG: glycosyltransferase family 4 protein [Roseiflexaceae bacterium]|nr:glycosyltransferase family 4 protein [Roseiflexus sp.]MDW8212387.1 glycosyltransferase family 4 protein [Roseiflexaceae bacterium]
MNVALLSAEYPPMPGGVGDYTRNLGMALLQRSHEVVVLTGAVNGAEDRQPLRVIRLPLRRWDWRCWRVVRRALNDLKPDVLHIQYQTGAYGMHPAINLLPQRLRLEANRPHLVVTAHDLLPPYLFPKAGPLRNWVTRRLMLDVDAVVATNDADEAQLRRWGAGRGDHTLAVIPIGANIAVAPPPAWNRQEWRARLGIAPEMTLIAHFGLMSRSKGVDTLIQALARLPETFRLIVIGGEATASQDRMYADEVRRQVAALRLSERVVITGYCDDATVSAHLLAADLAALPFTDGASFRRGSLLATLAHGVPTITTPGSASLADQTHVFLTPPGDPDALAGAIMRLASDPALRERLSAGGAALAAQFSWKAIARQHEELYGKLQYSGTSARL